MRSSLSIHLHACLHVQEPLYIFLSVVTICAYTKCWFRILLGWINKIFSQDLFIYRGGFSSLSEKKVVEIVNLHILASKIYYIYFFPKAFFSAPSGCTRESQLRLLLKLKKYCIIILLGQSSIAPFVLFCIEISHPQNL